MKKWLILAVMAAVAVGVQADEAGKKKKGKGKPITKEKYVAQQKEAAEKEGKKFNKKKAAKKFDKMDTNGDGKLTGDEKPKKKGKGNKEKSKNPAE